MLSSNGSSSTCILEVFRHSYSALSRRTGTLPPHGPPATASASSGTSVRRLSPGTYRAGDRGPPAPRPGGPDLDAGALRQYSAKPAKDGGKTTAGERQADTVLRGSPGQRDRAATGTGRSDTAASFQESQRSVQPPCGGWGRKEAAARAKPVPSAWSPGGRMGGAKAQHPLERFCPSHRGQERGLAAQPCAGAVQRRRGISRCTDRSASGCADWHTEVTTRARAWPRRRGGSASAACAMA